MTKKGPAHPALIPHLIISLILFKLEHYCLYMISVILIEVNIISKQAKYDCIYICIMVSLGKNHNSGDF